MVKANFLPKENKNLPCQDTFALAKNVGSKNSQTNKNFLRA